MKQLEKEITVPNKRDRIKRYQMYHTAASKLAEKTQNDTKEGGRK